MLRTKVVAVLLGPTGIGLVGIYMTTISLIRTLSDFGISHSGVREVSKANGEGDPKKIADTVIALRRVCWLTGVFGWALAAGFSWPLSKWALGSSSQSGVIGLLGVTILIGAVSGGQMAILQGIRRIGDLARIQVASAVISTFVAIPIYAWLGEKGIPPVIIVTAALQLLVSWHYSRKINIDEVSQTWMETTRLVKTLFILGFSFMWTALLGLVVDFTIRSFLIREFGIQANGIYQAAWGLSGMAAGFILGAMATDFSPHLTSIIHDHDRANRLVNEQTEIGILVALPCLVGMLAFAPWIIEIFYTRHFKESGYILPWFVVGTFIRVFSWPMGFILVAKGAARWFFLTQTIYHVTHVILVYSLVPRYGIVSAGFAFAITFVPGVIMNLLITRRLTRFRWTAKAGRLILISSIVVACAFMLNQVLPILYAFMTGLVLTAVTGMVCLRGLVYRVGTENRIVTLASRIPGVRWFLMGITGPDHDDS